MRVAGGDEKGRRLKGAVSSNTRATTERVRAAIFNILDPDLYQGRRVLDLFSGTGSLGIEALSHGAGWADFVEWDRRQSAVITSNLESTGFSSQAKVHRLDVLQALQTLPGNYDLVLMDPPYKMGNQDDLMMQVASQIGLIVEGGVVVAGHSKREGLKMEYGPLKMTSQRKYGDNAIDFFVYEQISDEQTSGTGQATEDTIDKNSDITNNLAEGTAPGQDGNI